MNAPPTPPLHTILLLDAREDDLDAMVEALQALEARIITAQTAAEAWKAVVNCNPEVSVIDFTLPANEGVEFYRKILSHPMTQGMRVITTHVSPSDEEIFQAHHLGCECSLIKPIVLSELQRFVGQLLMEGRFPRPAGR